MLTRSINSSYQFSDHEAMVFLFLFSGNHADLKNTAHFIRSERKVNGLTPVSVTEDDYDLAILR